MLAITLRIGGPSLLQHFLLQGGVTSELRVMSVNFKITCITELTYTLLTFSEISAVKKRK
jgi:hypothetical protein